MQVRASGECKYSWNAKFFTKSATFFRTLIDRRHRRAKAQSSNSFRRAAINKGTPVKCGCWPDRNDVSLSEIWQGMWQIIHNAVFCTDSINHRVFIRSATTYFGAIYDAFRPAAIRRTCFNFSRRERVGVPQGCVRGRAFFGRRAADLRSPHLWKIECPFTWFCKFVRNGEIASLRASNNKITWFIAVRLWVFGWPLFIICESG